jgi:triacylglycerol lipase
MSTIHLVDPAARAIAASLKVFDPERESLGAFRAQSRAMYEQMSPPMPDAREELQIPGTPTVRVLMYRRRNPRPPSGAIVYMHGGGFITGVAEIDDATCVRLAQEHNAVVLNVDYRLAPEASGVPVELHVYAGGVHGFDLFPGPTTDRFSADLRAALERFLAKEWT